MTSPRSLHIRFFAILREQAGCASLKLDSTAATAGELYQELQTKFPGLTFSAALLRVSLNERYAAMDAPLNAGDRVVFIPPVAGG